MCQWKHKRKCRKCLGVYNHYHESFNIVCDKKVQVGKDQEKAQSEKDSHSKNRGGKKSGTYTMKHIVSRMSSYFTNRLPLSYLNLTKIYENIHKAPTAQKI